MLKSLVTVLALSASVLAVPKPADGGLPKCGGDAPKSCNKLPAKSTKACLASITAANIAIKTCAKPTSVQVVTVTETAKPKFWKTTTSLVTSTSTFTQHENITVSSTLIQTEHATITETATDSTSTTSTYTQHYNVTSTELVSATATITTTSLHDQTKETCAVAQRGLEERGPKDRLPDDCSCFLTTTSLTGIETYKVTETYTPTVTTTNTVPAKATITSTWTITVPVTSTLTETWTDSTTVTSTSQITEVITTTWSFTSTTTSTQTQTQTTTSTIDVCATAAPLPSAIKLEDTAYAQAAKKPKNFADCCRACFNQKNCVYYDFNTQGKDCTLFISKKGSCKTDSCPKGKADVKLLDLKKNSKDLFGYGACVGAKW